MLRRGNSQVSQPVHVSGENVEMRIAIFDYRVIGINPTGSCHLALLRSLGREHKFTVFAVQFENPDPRFIQWVRVPVPTRPLALLFVAYHILAPCMYLWHRIRTGSRFDLVQSVESNLSFGKLIYSHFSHRTYLHIERPKCYGARCLLRKLDHYLHALVERFRYPSAEILVTPSSGLVEDLKRDFCISEERVHVIPNPIGAARMAPPLGFDRMSIRQQEALDCCDIVAIFVALGHFERKGLPLVLNALQERSLQTVALLVVGGEVDSCREYQLTAAQCGLGTRVRFMGTRTDVRPYLWSSDVFILPSEYESFSLAAYEAAAAGLPILATSVHGIRDILRDGITGFAITRSVESIVSALEKFMALPLSARRAVGNNARMAAQAFSEEHFAAKWRDLYRALDLKTDAIAPK